ncbi:RNA polymerase sigma factor for flagellar operon FliA [Ruminiclostridium sufflavum DSM 19573]|uniref:RNA polymerase sigma factor for flagellar operon FliA n=1 Tax=Ruminiclostridium sufflavum DSM 19573 TaxID=1121337 RepID=A0A318XR07_9FIRM|nr:FliA/WhiG family RNA polymerase sigma factor [Ruminiclostridium sufflavum]PYG89846.1 RNA polymerase sigma factor for flagellar operon FliA [Ruminiclostridium sufflavum DSM 19573]
MPGVNNNQLWKKYTETRDPVLKDELIVKYAYLIKYVAGRLSIYFGANVEFDDLVGYGAFGLIDAIEKFDVTKGVKFETYASFRIRGSIIDSIRDLDWVPRSLRQKNKELEKVYAEIENEVGHSATDKEVAEKMGISMEEFYKLLNDVNVSSMMSLEEFMEQNYERGLEIVSDSADDKPEAALENIEIKEILIEAIDKLPEKEKAVITFYYFEELTLKEISAIMNVTESRISQLHTKALLRMRGKLFRHRIMLES